MDEDEPDCNPFELGTKSVLPSSSFNIFVSNSSTSAGTSDSASVITTVTASSVASQSLFPSKNVGSIFGGRISSQPLPSLASSTVEDSTMGEPTHVQSLEKPMSPPSPACHNKIPLGYRIPKLSPPSSNQPPSPDISSQSLFGGHASVLSHSRSSLFKPLGSRDSVLQSTSTTQSIPSINMFAQPVIMSSKIGDVKAISSLGSQESQPAHKSASATTPNPFGKKQDISVPDIFGGSVLQPSSESFIDAHMEEQKPTLFSSKGIAFGDANSASLFPKSVDEATLNIFKMFGASEHQKASEISKESMFPKAQPVFQKKELGSVSGSSKQLGSRFGGLTEKGTDFCQMVDSDSDLDSKTEADDASNSTPKPCSEDNPNLTTLVAIDVPKDYLNRRILTNHFEKFGKVSKILINKISNQASIFFEDSASASEAKSKGKLLHPKLPEMKLLFRPQPIKKSKDNESPKSIQHQSRTLRRSSLSPVRRKEVSPAKKEHKAPSKTSRSLLLKRSSLSPTDRTKMISSKSPTRSKEVESPNISKHSHIRKESVVKSVRSFVAESERRGKKKTSGLDELRSVSRGCSPSPHILAAKKLIDRIKQQALNNEDKYRVLDARDKLIRSNIKKISELSQAKYLAATCPDMCPEKERYARDRQYDVSAFEMTSGELDQRYTVKKFSRSSADKDEPLPHELRPSSALRMSIDHLICNVIALQDDPNTQTDVWYNYLWNRTRALRNDIMQQHLVDATAVNVLEKCLRFHIHCSYHLCEESLEMFDPKMNVEHLTKSLQSLKELYHDLSEKNIFFDTEPEMRSYEILLNIYDGNIVFNYINFRDPVRNSKEVQFAIDVMHSAQSRNYIKFFELVPEASYLQACILHGHFQKVRLRALKTIVKAYNVPNNPQSLSLSKLSKMLGFTNKKGLKTFLEKFDLHADYKENVTIERQKVIPKPKISLCSTKTEMIHYHPAPISEIIQGGPLPSNPLKYYKPHNSFDEAGYLKASARDASDQSSALTSAATEGNYIELSTTALEMLLTNRVKHMHQLQIIKKYFQKWREFVQKERNIREFIDRRKLESLRKIAISWRHRAKRTSMLKKKADLMYLSKCFRRWKKFTAISKETKILNNYVEVALQKQVVKKLLHIWKTKSERSRRTRRLECLKERFIARKIFRLWKCQTDVALKQKQALVLCNKQILKFYFSKWRKWFIDEKTARQIDHESFPSAGSMLTVEKQNQLLHWSYNRDSSLNLSAKQYTKMNEEIKVKLNGHFIVNKLSDMIAWSPLQLRDHFQADLDKTIIRKSIFDFSFKLFLVVDESLDPYFLEWIRTKLNFFNASNISLPLHSIDYLSSGHSGAFCHIIVKEESLSSKLADIDGSSAIIMVTQKKNLPKAQMYLKSFEWLPHIFFCWNCEVYSITEKVWYLNEESLQEPASSERLLEVILDFWRKRNIYGNIYQSNLHNFVTGILSDEVLVPICKLIGQKKEYNNWTLPLFEVVNFYNEATFHLIKYIKGIDMPCTNWPPSEIEEFSHFPPKTWNQKEKQEIIEILYGLHLPPFSIIPCSSWDKLVAEVSQYVLLVIDQGNWGEDLKADVSKILGKTEEQFRMKRELHELDLEESDIYFELPWVDIFSSCLFYKFSLLPDLNLYLDHSQNVIPSMLREKWLPKIRLSMVNFSPPQKKNTSLVLLPKRKADVKDLEEEPFSKVKKVHLEFDDALDQEERKTKEFMQMLQDMLAD